MLLRWRHVAGVCKHRLLDLVDRNAEERRDAQNVLDRRPRDATELPALDRPRA
jgi:hypothetical protein